MTIPPNPPWDAATPYRTGVPTILKGLNAICRLMTEFDDEFKQYAPVEWHSAWDTLQSACDAFRALVKPPRS